MGPGRRARGQGRYRRVADQARDPAEGTKKIAPVARAAGARPICSGTIAAPDRRGASLGLWGGGDVARARAIARLDDIAAVGATDVALVVGWSQPDVRASGLTRGASTPSDADVRAVAAAARDRGLAVVMFPIVIVERTAPGEWRGTLAPRDVDAWWQAYERFVGHYASIAAATGASALVVGSELGSTEAWRDRWYHLISAVDKVYDGALWYSANWDHYDRVSFWPRLDAIGVTGYFELGRDRDAGVAALTRAWRAPRDALIEFARHAGKPLILTEVGYPSRDGAATRPWDYTGDGAIDLEEQRRAFRALADAWTDRAAGVFIWEWSGDGGERDGGYAVRGKPARCEVERWFLAPPPITAPASAP